MADSLSQLSNAVEHLGFGCVALTHQPTQRHAMRLLTTAMEAGICHFDTAPSYGSGYSEILLGKFAQKNRERIKIATKVGTTFPPISVPPSVALPLHAIRRFVRSLKSAPTHRYNPKPQLLAHRIIDLSAVSGSVEGSLSRLQCDRIDLLLLHETLPTFLTEEARDYLFDLRRSGTVGKLGVAANGANYFNLSQSDLKGWDVLQYEYGEAWPRHFELPRLFPQQEHIFHSCLRPSSSGEIFDPGQRLSKILANHPEASLLFSTRKPERIESNVEAIDRSLKNLTQTEKDGPCR